MDHPIIDRETQRMVTELFMAKDNQAFQSATQRIILELVLQVQSLQGELHPEPRLSKDRAISSTISFLEKFKD